MKRFVFILLTAVMLLIISNAGTEGIREWYLSAEPTATPAPNAFRFRDGIRWGMNKEQVKALETESMTERSMQSWSVMFTDGKVAVSRFVADLIFMFREDRLLMISYEFPQGTQDAYQYLTGALVSLYGEKAEAEPLKIKVLMDAINPNRYKTEMIKQAGVWTTQDGTTIYMYYFANDSYAITYVSPELDSRMYNTNGL